MTAMDTQNQANGHRQQSLSTAAARRLATTQKTVPQMRAITPRWLLRFLPWKEVNAGVYRVNRVRTSTVGDGRISVTLQDERPRIDPAELQELRLLRGLNGNELLSTLAERFTAQHIQPGSRIVENGEPADRFFVIAHGKVEKHRPGRYGDEVRLGFLTNGDHFDQTLLATGEPWSYGVRAVTPCTLMALPRDDLLHVAEGDAQLRARLSRADLVGPASVEHQVDLTAGHAGEVDLPTAFVDYQEDPSEYELSLAQSIIHVRTRVADLFNDPMDQTVEQLRLAVEALRERQEWEMVNNRDFGLLANAALSHRIPTRGGPPTPDDLDELLGLIWKKPAFFVAHPRAIAAFGRECTSRGVPPPTVEIAGSPFVAWRGVPLIPCDKLEVDSLNATTNILLMRVGEAEQGVVGLHQPGLVDEYEPSLTVRDMGIDTKGIRAYLLTAYFSLAVLVDDALGVLEDVEVGQYHEYR